MRLDTLWLPADSAEDALVDNSAPLWLPSSPEISLADQATPAAEPPAAKGDDAAWGAETVRLLFVDDDPHVLDGLRRMLRGMRHQWEAHFVTSAAAALEFLAQHPCDVVISDMRMPGSDGVELFDQVRQWHPHAIRLALSGHSDPQMLLRAAGAVHQFLAKPCDPETLRSTIARALSLRRLLSAPLLKKIASQVRTLPSPPSLYLEIMQELQSPDPSIQRLAKAIGHDVGMTAKMLQLVNSSFFGTGRHVATPEQAVKFLGMDAVSGLVLSMKLFSQFDARRLPGLSLEQLHQRSLTTGAVAKQICQARQAEKTQADHAFLAGLLHKVGILILAEKMPQAYGWVLSRSQRGGRSLAAVEREAFGVTHAELGAYLLGLWGLPMPIVEAVAYHLTPSHCPLRQFSPLTAVHVASRWCKALEHGPATDPCRRAETSIDGTGLDLSYLQEVGVVEELPLWRERCASTLENTRDE
jgi:HD-like signal output (HDOD) protein/CheY-like chemotaxis protein